MKMLRDALGILVPRLETAWFDDLGQIAALLSRKGIPEDQHWPLITEARERARAASPSDAWGP
jgi:hypothetical protein